MSLSLSLNQSTSSSVSNHEPAHSHEGAKSSTTKDDVCGAPQSAQTASNNKKGKAKDKKTTGPPHGNQNNQSPGGGDVCSSDDAGALSAGQIKMNPQDHATAQSSTTVQSADEKHGQNNNNGTTTAENGTTTAENGTETAENGTETAINGMEMDGYVEGSTPHVSEVGSEDEYAKIDQYKRFDVHSDDSTGSSPLPLPTRMFACPEE
jgi:hypothetical protein